MIVESTSHRQEENEEEGQGEKLLRTTMQEKQTCVSNSTDF
jgi:hypothetical protein